MPGSVLRGSTAAVRPLTMALTAQRRGPRAGGPGNGFGTGSVHDVAEQRADRGRRRARGLNRRRFLAAAATAGVGAAGAAAVISLGHDEYWTPEQRQHITRARGAGTNLAFLGVNACYRRINAAAPGRRPGTTCERCTRPRGASSRGRARDAATPPVR